MESTTCYTFTPCVGYFTSPAIDTRIKGPTAFYCKSSERHWQGGAKEIGKCFQAASVASSKDPPF